MGMYIGLVSLLLSTVALTFGNISSNIVCSSFQNCAHCISKCIWCSQEQKCISKASWFSLELPCVGAIVHRIPEQCRIAEQVRDESQVINHPEESPLAYTLDIISPIQGAKVHANVLVEIQVQQKRSVLGLESAAFYLYLGLIDPSGNINERNISLGEQNRRLWIRLDDYGAYQLRSQLFGNGIKLSDMKTNTFDRVSSLQLEQGVFSSNKLHPGFPSNIPVSDWIIKSSIFLEKYSDIITYTRDDSKVPKIIHQIWTHGKDDLVIMEKEMLHIESKGDYVDQVCPAEDSKHAHSNKPYFLRFTKSWQDNHPDWEYKLWTKESMRSLVKEEFPFFLDIYDGFKQEIKRIDAFRYLILFRFGGVVIDIDFECLSNMSPLLNNCLVCLGREQWDKKDRGNPNTDQFRQLATGWMGSTQGHPFWWFVINEVTRRAELQRSHQELLGVIRATGPQLLEDCARTYYKLYPETKMRVLSNEIYPIGPGNGDAMNEDQCCVIMDTCKQVYPQAYAVHHYSASWYEQYIEELEHERVSLLNSKS